MSAEVLEALGIFASGAGGEEFSLEIHGAPRIPVEISTGTVAHGVNILGNNWMLAKQAIETTDFGKGEFEIFSPLSS